MAEPMPEADDFASELRGEMDERERFAIERTKPVDGMANRITLMVAIASIITQVGTVAWWGGRIDQRLQANEADDKDRSQRIEQLARDNARQDAFIAASNVQYSEIMRRLDGIDRKLDAR